MEINRIVVEMCTKEVGGGRKVGGKENGEQEMVLETNEMEILIFQESGGISK